MIFVVATIRIKPGTEAQIRAEAGKCRSETLKEPGCITYDLHQSISDPLQFVFVERWKTREDLQNHLSMPHFKAWRAVSADWVSERQLQIVHAGEIETF